MRNKGVLEFFVVLNFACIGIYVEIFWNKGMKDEVLHKKFFIKDFFSKYCHIRRKLQIWSHLLEKSLMENFIICVVLTMTLFEKKIMNLNSSVIAQYVTTIVK